MGKQPLAKIVLITPEIPQNTGNIIRLCANVGAELHLVEPLGFKLTESYLRRAALDYSDMTNVVVHNSTVSFFDATDITRTYAAVSDGTSLYTEPNYQPGDVMIFGPESIGLPQDVTDRIDPGKLIKIPMIPGNRSLNLSNAAAIIVYEMWRQMDFYVSL